MLARLRQGVRRRKGEGGRTEVFLLCDGRLHRTYHSAVVVVVTFAVVVAVESAWRECVSGCFLLRESKGGSVPRACSSIWFHTAAGRFNPSAEFEQTEDAQFKDRRYKSHTFP